MNIKKVLFNTIVTVVIFANLMQPLSFAINYGEELQNQPNKYDSRTFSDVPESYWAFPYIEEMVSRGVLSGYPDGKFYPDNTITRAEFAKMIVICSGVLLSHDSNQYFSDVPESYWAFPYVSAARFYLTGYSTPYGDYYYPTQNALREDIAIALVKIKGYSIFGADESILTTMFSDSLSISANARPYVAIAVERGLVSGYDDSTFRGQSSITRAEAAAMLWRAYQYGNDNKILVDSFIPDIPEIGNESATPEPIIMSDATQKPEDASDTKKSWESITLDSYVDENRSYDYMTYDSHNNYVYYYDEKKNYIYIYDIYNNEVIPYLDCSSLCITEDTNEVVTYTPSGNYYNGFEILDIDYDNFKKRLYVNLSSNYLNEGGLDDKYVSSRIYVFYISSNGEISTPYLWDKYPSGIRGFSEEGIIVFRKLLDRDGYYGCADVKFNINAIDNSLLYDKKWYFLSETSNGTICLSLNDFVENKVIRDMGPCVRCGLNDGIFYGWNLNNQIISCDLNGNLSILIDIDKDVEITDMDSLHLSNNDIGKYKMIVSTDAIVFVDNSAIRIIRKI